MKNISKKRFQKVGLVLIALISCIGSSSAQCLGTGTTNAIQFGSSGGSVTRSVSTSCGTFSAISQSPSFTVTYTSSSFTVSCTPSGEYRVGGIQLNFNNIPMGFVTAKQNTPPPPPCIVSGFTGGSYTGAAQTINYPLSFSNCSSTTMNYTDGGNPLPSWISISPSGNTAVVQLQANNGGSSRSVNILATNGGLSATITQACNLKTWYPDSDNDNFADSLTGTQQSCAEPSPGNWTTSTTLDNCPGDYSLTNITQTWYLDTDDDGFPDSTTSPVQQCNEPSPGNWTTGTTVDPCPNAYDITDGCPPDCTKIALTPPYMDFDRFGGETKTSTVSFTDGCSSGSITISNIPNFVTASVNGTTITVTSNGSSTQAQGGVITVLVNGQTASTSLAINQQGPPPPCVITGYNGGTYSGQMHTLEFPLSFSNCSPGDVTLSGNGQPLNDGWKQVVLEGSVLKITLQPNNGADLRSILITGSTGNGSFGGTITQACNLKTWYPDSDNDNFADSLTGTQQSCAEPSPGNWTTSTTLDNCPGDYSLTNITQTWYEDTDDDGFPDSTASPVQQCNEPSPGDWTTSTTVDPCPNAYDITDGCPPDCTKIAFNPPYMDFDRLGGETKTSTISFTDGCSSGNITLNNIPNFVTANISGTTITVTSNGPSTQAQGGTITVFVNGQPANVSLAINQQGPPVNPPSCTFNGISNVILDKDGGSDVRTATFTPANCDGPVFLKQVNDDPLPVWLTIQPSGNTFTFSAGANTESNTRSVSLKAVDAAGGFFQNAVFQVTQPPTTICLTNWYPDQDGDDLGDATALPHYSCDPPTGEGYAFIDNNDDLCPFDVGTSANQGCPSGVAPEKRNTVTTWIYDLNNVVKTSSKSYFDDLGKLEQTQSWDVKSDSIWAAASLYDEFGRPMLQTLSAPIREGLTYQFKDGFIKKTDDVTDYGLLDYDGTNSENPNPIGDAPETLGWYYSEDNDHEEYQDVTAHPFTKSIYSDLNPGKVLRTVGGNKINEEWPQGYTFSIKSSEELAQQPAFNETVYNTIEIIKTVSRDVHGVENVVFSDTDGKVLAAARSGAAGVESAPMTVNIPEQGFVDVHIAEGITGFTVSNSGAVTVYDLITESPVTGATSGLGKGFYRVAVNDLDTYVPESVGVTYTVNYYDYSLNEYDEADRLVKSYQPLGATKATKLFITYEYNTLGQLQRTTSPDEGEAEFKYREDGQIRFSQNSKQKDPNEDGNFNDTQFSYTNYDTYGRPVESGVYSGGSVTFTNSDSILENLLEDITIDNDGLANANCLEQTFTLYDVQDTAGLHAALNASGIAIAGYPEQGFVSSNVSNTFTIDSQMATITWYSYDVYGRVEWVVQQIQGLGTKTIDYSYDPITGLVLRVDYQKDTPSERFVHRYEYNSGDQLVKVETSIDNTIFTLNAEYEYYETGAMKSTELAGGVQGIDYVYNLAGQLKSINHPSLTAANDPGGDTNDLFGMQMDYHTNDYSRTSRTNITTQSYGQDQLNGNIKGIRWKNDAVPGATGELLYSYSYDRNNWLQAADFDGDGTIGDGTGPGISSADIIENGGSLVLEDPNVITLTNGFHAKEGSDVTIRIVAGTGGTTIMDSDYDVSNITYDANGNILSLKRNKQTQSNTNTMDNLAYSYETGTNKLLQVTDADGDVTNADDIGSQTDAENYKYNAIGQLVENVSEGITYSYNASGLVTEIRKNGLSLVTFFYNDRNHRVRKDTYDGGGINVTQTTHYVRDVSGSVMGIYTNNTLVEQPIYGSGRIAVFNRQSNNSVYELTDHLGNVRAAFAVNNGNTNTLNATDYYPGGMAMPGRNLVGDYRYNYQGQELDKETGKVAFEARLYDPRIMRWLTVDPAGEFASPYLAMGNNFPNVVDPDGRCTTCPDGAKVGDTFEHAEFGTLEYTENGWGSNSAGFVLDDIVVVGTNFSREAGVGVNTFSVPNSMTVGDFQQNIRDAVGSIKARHDMHVLGLTTDLAIEVTLTLGVNAIFPAGRVAPRPSLNFAPKFKPRVIFRAVDDIELASIRNTGVFKLNIGGTEVKYFARSLDDVHMFGNKLYPNGYNVVKASFPNASKYWSPHTDRVGAYIVPKIPLSTIKPLNIKF